MVVYKRSIKSQLSTTFCIGVGLAFITVITGMVLYIFSEINSWYMETKDEVQKLQFVKNSYSLQSRGSMIQNELQMYVNDLVLLSEA